MAQEGDTSDRPWACVQLYQQLLCGSGPAPSTSLLEMCYSRSTPETSQHYVEGRGG